MEGKQFIPDERTLRFFPNLHAEMMTFQRRAREAAERGEDFLELLKTSARCQLLHRERQHCEKVEVGGCSKSCGKMNGKVMSVQEALVNLPVPNPKCKNKNIYDTKVGFCTGSYDIHLD